ncbi:discoidin domain-containing protein [Neobacillus niacini]|uniref:discoidin domain-containing protein n=1 Tax=Neobacillus niacini TaxID=86668 RepID=UPI0005EE9B06|nr:discoidin domain-containing protein [Neobacillus niacini]
MKQRKIREVLNFNTEWLFHKGEFESALNLECDDRNWERVALPHTVQLEPKEWVDSPSYQGISFYRRYFTLAPKYMGKKIFIRFQGVMINSEVWMNGQLLCTHQGGYLPFTVDITKSVVFGENNVISIKVDTNDDWQTPPGKPQKELDFVYFGGLYRSVEMIITENVYITDAIHANKIADGGVFITYPEVGTDKAVVRVQSNIQNDFKMMKNVSVETMIIDEEENKIVASEESVPIEIEANSDHTFIQKVNVNLPKLWSMRNPNLYTLNIKVKTGNQVVDDYQTRIGIRKIEFTTDRGFFINDEKVLLNGVNSHEDYLYVGNAVSDSMLYRDVKKIKEAGFNFIRTGHYPHNQAFMNACDELGIATIVPTPGWQYYTPKGEFSERSFQMTREMIRLFRNNPSVILWEPILNETWYPEEFAKEAYKIVHEEFPTNQAFATSDFGAPFGDQFDVVYKEAYSETKPLITREWGDANHNLQDGERSARKHGESGLANSSYHRQNSLKGNKWKDANEEDGYWDWSGLNANPRISGYALWSYNDYNRGSEREISYSGIVDRDRYPKFNYYWFQSQCPPEENNGPTLFIANYWTKSSPKDVHVYTNTEKVNLYVNEKLVDTRSPEKVEYIAHPIIIFPEVPWEPGVLKAEGLINDKVVISNTVTTPSEATHLCVEFQINEMEDFIANSSDMVMAYITIRDKFGNIVPTANQSISLHLSGPGILIGNAEERTKANPVMAEAGIAPALIRSTSMAGEITLTATSPGLEQGSASITNVPYHGEFVPKITSDEMNIIKNNHLALPYSIVGSSEDADYNVNNLNDGNPKSCWKPCKIDQQPSLLLDLGESLNVTGSKLIWNSEGYPKEYKMEVSNNKRDWITLVNRLDVDSSNLIMYEYFASNARYIRIHFSSPFMNAGIVDLQIFGAKKVHTLSTQNIQNENIACNKIAYASSFSEGNEPLMAINQDLKTMWQANSFDTPQWLLIDLEDENLVAGAKVIWGKDSTHYSYKIQVSKNGHDWIDAIDQTTTGSYYKPINFSSSCSVRYVRFWIYDLMAGGGSEKVAIKEVEVYCN